VIAFNRTLEISPGSFATNALLATALSDGGRFDDALKVLEREPDELWKNWAKVIVNFFAGNKKESDVALETVERIAVDADAYQLAEIHAVRGEMDQAFECLERAVHARDAGVTHSKVNPRFRNLVNDDRWPGILARIGL
jgi:thioredoxin-like negative regulator of GroEL